MIVNVLYLSKEMLSILDGGTSRVIDKKEGITMDTEYLELYEDYQVKVNGLKRPNYLIDLFCDISNYNLLDAKDGKYNVIYHHLNPKGVVKKEHLMELKYRTLFITDQYQEYFKDMFGAKKVIYAKK